MADYVIPWIIFALILVFTQIVIGVYAKKHWLGILVDSRNKYSLSRLQIVLWTTLLVSAFCAVLWHFKSTSIYIPPEVWSLMAISTGSAAAAVLIKDNKSQQQPTPAAAQRGAAADAAPAPPALGVLATAWQPGFSDIFLGDEIADKRYVDIGKVQMFFFTIAAFVGYCSALYGCVLTDAPPDLKEKFCVYFPSLSTSLLTLIGISHAGYLTVKASPKTQTAN